MKNANICFTGTRKGLSKQQLELLQQLLSNMENPITFRHGDCVGADEQAHKIAVKTRSEIIIHPPTDEKYRAFCKSKLVLNPDEYLRRNHTMVDRSQILIAAPDSNKEKKRSGTWATVRYARKKGLYVFILPR